MPFRLLRMGLSRSAEEPRFLPQTPPLRPTYDVVIIGGGGHGLACAYYLAQRHGIRNIAVLEADYIGGGNTGRNTAIVRSNYLTPEGVRFYEASRRLYRDLSAELDINLFYSERGHYTLAHNDNDLHTMRWRAEVNRHCGVDSEVVDRASVAQAVPELDLDCGGDAPVLGALYHPPGAIVRHDAVAWGYARAASQLGVEIHQKTRVQGLQTEGQRVTGITTDRGSIRCGAVVSAVAGQTPQITQHLGLYPPIQIHPLQACVTEPVKPFLDTIIVSASLHVYMSQSSRGELVLGGAVDPQVLHCNRASYEFLTGLADHVVDLLPMAGRLRIMRHWAGKSDLTPDFAPIMGKTPVKNFYLDAGWGTWGFKATPIAGATLADCVATDQTPELIRPFRMERFSNQQLLGEKGAASVGH